MLFANDIMLIDKYNQIKIEDQIVEKNFKSNISRTKSN